MERAIDVVVGVFIGCVLAGQVSVTPSQKEDAKREVPSHDGLACAARVAADFDLSLESGRVRMDFTDNIGQRQEADVEISVVDDRGNQPVWTDRLPITVESRGQSAWRSALLELPDGYYVVQARSFEGDAPVFARMYLRVLDGHIEQVDTLTYHAESLSDVAIQEAP